MECQFNAMCSRQTGFPSNFVGTNSITNGEPGSAIERSVSPIAVAVTPSSSIISRRAASNMVSPGSSFPPGNSQSPPCRLASGRWHTK